MQVSDRAVEEARAWSAKLSGLTITQPELQQFRAWREDDENRQAFLKVAARDFGRSRHR